MRIDLCSRSRTRFPSIAASAGRVSAVDNIACLPRWRAAPSAGPPLDAPGGPPGDVALSHVLGDRRGRAGLGVAKAAASRLDDAHALPGCELVATLGVHRLAVDGVHPQGPVTAAEQTARGKHCTVAHTEGRDQMAGVVAQDHLLTEAAAPLPGTAGIRQQ